MKVTSLIIFALLSLIQTSYANLSDKKVSLLNGDFYLNVKYDNSKICPVTVQVEHTWEESLDIEGINIINTSIAQPESFVSMFYINKSKYSYFESDLVIPNINARQITTTKIENNEIGFTVENLWQKQERKSLVSIWQTLFFTDLNLSLEIRNNSVYMSIVQKSSSWVNASCEYVKIN